MDFLSTIGAGKRAIYVIFGILTVSALLLCLKNGECFVSYLFFFGILSCRVLPTHVMNTKKNACIMNYLQVKLLLVVVEVNELPITFSDGSRTVLAQVGKKNSACSRPPPPPGVRDSR